MTTVASGILWNSQHVSLSVFLSARVSAHAKVARPDVSDIRGVLGFGIGGVTVVLGAFDLLLGRPGACVQENALFISIILALIR